MQKPLGAVVMAALVVTSACSKSTPPGEGPGGGMAFPPAAVKLAVAKTAPVQEATEYVASLRSMSSTNVQPQVDGQLTQLLVKSGDRVVRGAPIAQIDPRRQQAAVSSQEAERVSREAQVSFARQQLVRAKDLYAAGAISKQEFEQAETALRTAEAALQSLQAQLQQQQVQLKYFTVVAPVAGVIGDVPVRVGFQVSPQTVLTTIDQNDALEVYVDVPVERARDLRIGTPIEVLASDRPDVLATTTVSFISPRVDDQTQSVLVKGLVRNSGAGLRSSQYVRARIIWKTTDGLVVPVLAVARINGQAFAFVADEAKGGSPTGLVARQRLLRLGTLTGDDYAVLDGLKVGDRVVVSGVQKLADGAPIMPEGATPAAPPAGAPSPKPGA